MNLTKCQLQHLTISSQPNQLSACSIFDNIKYLDEMDIERHIGAIVKGCHRQVEQMLGDAVEHIAKLTCCGDVRYQFGCHYLSHIVS